MSPHHHRFCGLFAQLDPPSDEAGISAFIQSHSPLDPAARLGAPTFRTPAQSALLRQLLLNDADWAEVADQLNLTLRPPRP